MNCLNYFNISILEEEIERVTLLIVFKYSFLLQLTILNEGTG